MTIFLKRNGVLTEAGYRSVKNFQKRAKLWRKKIDEATDTYLGVIRAYVRFNGPVRLCVHDYSEKEPVRVTAYDRYGEHGLVFDMMDIRGDTLVYHLEEKDGVHCDKWLTEEDLPIEIQKKLFLSMEYPEL